MSKSKLKPEIEQSVLDGEFVTNIDCHYSYKSVMSAHKLFSDLLLKKEYGPVAYLNFNEASFYLEFARKPTKAEIKEEEASREQEDAEFLQKRVENLKKSAAELGFSLAPLK